MEKYTVHVNAGAGYDVISGRGLLPCFGGMLHPILGDSRVAVVTDSNVEKLYLDGVLESLSEAGFDACSFVFPAGERSKTLSTMSDILDFLASQGFTRGDCVAALGGGVTGDISGFAAGCYMRGIRYVQLPTTLLAAVDSSVGGKTAVDLPQGKNLAGLFKQPAAVICDTACFDTLSPYILADGMAEAIKTGILSGEELFSAFEKDPISHLPEIVRSCAAFKGAVVEADELELGVRKTLNLGHTFGHAIEKLSGFGISHGHAVAAGTACAARAAVRMGLCSKETALRIEGVLLKNDLPASADYSPEEIAKAALSDKKRSGGEITLVLPRAIGDCTLVPIPVEELPAAVAAGTEAL